MKTLSILIACLSISISVLKGAEEIDVKSCPPIGWQFKISPYLNVASALQAEGKDSAIRRLRSWADTRAYEDQMVVLCRMLFEPKGQGEFRRPRIGAPSFFGGTSTADWPLEPIALHDGVPILVTETYRLAGEPEASRDYLQYCIEKCEWRAVPYRPRTPEELKKAVAGWLSQQRWQRPLDSRGQAFFAGQAEPDAGK